MDKLDCFNTGNQESVTHFDCVLIGSRVSSSCVSV